MKLSVIIVNYNVRHFLEQCLFSVFKATEKIEVEIFVVDNHSVDGSCAMIKEKFPVVGLIENKVNTGFAKANNQALKLAAGKYILLLNPDTVVEEDTFIKVIDFMDSHPDAGGLGVKMIDGKGNFLPESKRGFPTPATAFYKMSGLSRIFSRSRIFNKYHLGFLDKDEINQVEILSGAFMLLRKETLDKTGFLDESFFMYGEDIDLSYRIIQSGYKNYYFPGTTIIHYKGESTKKGSVNYVRMFYNAMAIFAKKHFTGKNAFIFYILISMAIWFRAFVAVIAGIIKNALKPAVDAIIIYSGFYLITLYWEKYRYSGDGTYPDEFLLYVVPSYVVLWLAALYYMGGYSRHLKLINVFKGTVLGTLLVLVFYALLSEDVRFSRAILLLGSLWTVIMVLLLRFTLNFSGIAHFKLHNYKKKRIVLAGSAEECRRVENLLVKSGLQFDPAGYVSTGNGTSNGGFIGNISEMSEIAGIHKIDEIIFCSQDIPSANVIQIMVALSEKDIDFKIAGPGSLAIIGSNSINSAGELYQIKFNSIATEFNRKNKRIFDVVISLLFLIFSPFLIFFQKKPLHFMTNVIKVIFSGYTWVGYLPSGNIHSLPTLKKGILFPVKRAETENITDELSGRMNLMYAKDYNIMLDITIVFRNLRNLGS